MRMQHEGCPEAEFGQVDKTAWYDIADLRCVERDLRKLLQAICRHDVFVKDADDRIGYLWALKRMAEDIAQLDTIDRLEAGYLPIQIRPPLMLHATEVELLLAVVSNHLERSSSEGVAQLQRRISAYVSR